MFIEKLMETSSGAALSLRATPEPSETEGWRAIYEVNLPFGAGFFLRSRESMVPSDYGPAIQRNVCYFDGDLNSQGVVILGDEESLTYCLIGAISAYRSLSYFSVSVRQKRFETVSVYQPDVKGLATPEELVILQGSDWKELLKQYAQRVSQYYGLTAFEGVGENVLGYCTWYYSYEGVSEEEFGRNLDGLAKFANVFPTHYAQIDDGYQTHHGDWLETNERWPSKLDVIARRVVEKGFLPGIWTMPLLASTASRLFREKPEWFVKNKNGDPVITPGWSQPPEHQWACLDASREDVLAHLEEVFSTLYAWGYRYFKMDGLGLSYPDGIRLLPDETGISALRSAMEVIRRAVKDSVILSCGGPYLATVGLANHSRMSGDTGNFWKARGLPNGSGPRLVQDWENLDPTIPCLYNALTQSLQHWWMYDRWFRADPDVVIVRDRKSHLTLGETRMSALSAILTGIVFTSDKLDEISEERMAILQRTARLRCLYPEPILESDAAEVSVYAGTVDGRPALAIFNWSREAQTWVPAELGFNGDFREMLHPQGLVAESITIPSHDAVLLVEQPVGKTEALE